MQNNANERQKALYVFTSLYVQHALNKHGLKPDHYRPADGNTLDLVGNREFSSIQSLWFKKAISIGSLID